MSAPKSGTNKGKNKKKGGAKGHAPATPEIPSAPTKQPSIGAAPLNNPSPTPPTATPKPLEQSSAIAHVAKSSPATVSANPKPLGQSTGRPVAQTIVTHSIEATPSAKLHGQSSGNQVAKADNVKPTKPTTAVESTGQSSGSPVAEADAKESTVPRSNVKPSGQSSGSRVAEASSSKSVKPATAVESIRQSSGGPVAEASGTKSIKPIVAVRPLGQSSGRPTATAATPKDIQPTTAVKPIGQSSGSLVAKADAKESTVPRPTVKPSGQSSGSPVADAGFTRTIKAAASVKHCEQSLGSPVAEIGSFKFIEPTAAAKSVVRSSGSQVAEADTPKPMQPNPVAEPLGQSSGSPVAKAGTSKFAQPLPMVKPLQQSSGSQVAKAGAPKPIQPTPVANLAAPASAVLGSADIGASHSGADAAKPLQASDSANAPFEVPLSKSQKKKQKAKQKAAQAAAIKDVQEQAVLAHSTPVPTPSRPPSPPPSASPEADSGIKPAQSQAGNSSAVPAAAKVSVPSAPAGKALTLSAKGLPLAQPEKALPGKALPLALPRAIQGVSTSGHVVDAKASSSSAVSTHVSTAVSTTVAVSDTPLSREQLSKHLSGVHKPKSEWLCQRVAQAQGLRRKELVDKVKFEGVPNCPGYCWPADQQWRNIGSGGQASIHYVEYWFEDAKGTLQRRPRAVKVLPYDSPYQVALADREADNLAALSAGGQPCEFAPTLFHKVIAPSDSGSQRAWLYMSLIEGEELSEYMAKALEKVKGNNLVQVVAPIMQRLLQVVATLHTNGQRCFGDMKPENVMVQGKKQLTLVDFSSSLDNTQEAIKGAPYTLGYAPPEAMAAAATVSSPPSPLALHKGDVYSVGVMGLVWLSGKGNMPFGPTKAQAMRMQTAQGAENGRALEAAMMHVGRMQQEWADAVSAASLDGSAKAGQWPDSFAGALQGVPKGASVRRDAEAFFMALLHPDSARRADAAEALQHSFLRHC